MSSNNFRSHAAHPERSKSVKAEGALTLDLPSKYLNAESPHVNALLEHLDDVIFAAVRGDKAALEEACMLWPEIVRAIGWELVEESREQYLRYALDVTRSGENIEDRNPEHAIMALEVISLLTRD